jgi:hypothetical protein
MYVVVWRCMPKVTVWIREADYDKWKAIYDKPAALSAWLNDGFLPIKLIIPFLEAAKFEDNRTIKDLKAYCNRLLNSEPELKQTSDTGVLASAYLEEQYGNGDVQISSDILYTEPEDVA